MLRTLMFLALLAMAVPAWADVTGRFRGPDGVIVTVEVDEGGMSRVGAEGAADHTLFDDSDGYVVTTEAGAKAVVRLSDLRAVTLAEIGELLGMPAETPAEETDSRRRWVAAGEAVVDGRTGTEYRLPEEALPEGQKIVLSDDARLAPLGLAWSRVLFLMPSPFGPFGPEADPGMRQLGAMMETRAPLQLGEISLVSASFDDIDPARFALPAAPLSREQVAAMMEARRQRDQASGD